MEQNENLASVFDVFGTCQETYQEAKQKNAEESSSFSQTKHFRVNKDGTYAIRILPNAPVIKDGVPLPLDRKSYEYPIKSLVLKLENPKSKNDKKAKPIFVGVCNAKYAKKTVDIIDTYVGIACESYSDDAKLIEKIKSNSFDGGLKWDSQRAMYIIDADKREDGIQLLTLTYSQYKDLDDAKLKIWDKLLKKNDKQPCPISSINNAYFVEMTRTTENKHTKYGFSVDTLSGEDALKENELTALLDAPRIPEAIYRYTRWHLEGTIEYLKQYDEKMKIDVMNNPAMLDAIEKLKLELPADDLSHFSFEPKKKGNDADDDSDSSANDMTIDMLYDRYDALVDNKKDDKSTEGQELREDIRQYVSDNNLGIRIARGKTNQMLLEEIESVLDEKPSDVPTTTKQPDPVVEKEVIPEPTVEEEPEDDEPEEPEEPEVPVSTRVDRGEARRQRRESTNR